MPVYRKEETTPVIQRLCLDIALDIDRVCRENRIRYSLCAGSVIGAMLYGGFIPWDDDIDLMMTRQDYDRFLRIYPKKCARRYHLHHYSTDGADNLPALFARVEDTETRTTEEIARGVREGRVFVDITVFDQVPNAFVYRMLRYYAGFEYTYLYRMNGMTPGTPWKRRMMSLLPENVSPASLVRRYSRLEGVCRRNSRSGSKYCAELLSAAYSGILYESRIFDTYTDIDFEKHALMIVRDYRDYLQMRYGRTEFSKEVPEEQRQQSHIVEVETEAQVKKDVR